MRRAYDQQGFLEYAFIETDLHADQQYADNPRNHAVKQVSDRCLAHLILAGV